MRDVNLKSLLKSIIKMNKELNNQVQQELKQNGVNQILGTETAEKNKDLSLAELNKLKEELKNLENQKEVEFKI